MILINGGGFMSWSCIKYEIIGHVHIHILCENVTLMIKPTEPDQLQTCSLVYTYRL